MKTLHIVNRIYPFYMGGTEIHTYNFCRQLKNSEKIQPIIFSLKTNRNRNKFYLTVKRKEGLKFYFLELPAVDNKKNLIYYLLLYKFFLIFYFFRILKKEKPSFVHFHHLLDMGGWLILLTKIKNIPFALDLVDYWYLCPNINFFCNGSLTKCAQDCFWQRPSGSLAILLKKLNFKFIKFSYGLIKVIIHKIFWRLILNYSGALIFPCSQKVKEIYENQGIMGKRMVIKPCGIKSFKILPRKKKKTVA